MGTIKIGDLVRLNRAVFPMWLSSSSYSTVFGSVQPKMWVELTPAPEPCDYIGPMPKMHVNDVATVIGFSDCGLLAARVLAPSGVGWIPTALLEKA